MSKNQANSRFSGMNDAQLMDELSYYGAFHQNPVNQWLHFITVPLIQWSFIILLHGFGPVYTNDFLDSIGCQIGFGTFGVALYVYYYFSIGNWVVTTTYNIIQMALLIHANLFITAHMENALFWFVLSQIIGWGLQIPLGHLTFEKRNPSVSDSSTTGILMAPLFTWLEILWICGYDLEFKALLQVEIDKKIVLMNQGKSIAPKRNVKAQ